MQAIENRIIHDAWTPRSDRNEWRKGPRGKIDYLRHNGTAVTGRSLHDYCVCVSTGSARPVYAPTESEKGAERPLSLLSALLKLEEMGKLEEGWDSYDAPPPKPEVINQARRSILQLYAFKLIPSRILASVEGGVTVCFFKPAAYADLEFLNNGEVLAAFYSGDEPAEIWTIDDERQMNKSITRLKTQLGA